MPNGAMISLLISTGGYPPEPFAVPQSTYRCHRIDSCDEIESPMPLGHTLLFIYGTGMGYTPQPARLPPPPPHIAPHHGTAITTTSTDGNVILKACDIAAQRTHIYEHENEPST